MSLLAAIGRLTKLWARGDIPPEHAPLFCAANLTPLRKAAGGVRPVAVGDILRRLVGKTLLSTGLAREQISKLAPLQTGIGIKGATEAVAMTCQSIVDLTGPQGAWVMLKVDMSNAFNCVSRKCVLQGALQYCPSVYNFLLTAYRTRAPLFSGGRVLWSEEGTHQGCPLGPLGFALGIHPILEQIRDEHAPDWQSWYLDGGILFGSPECVARCLSSLQVGLADRGLSINLSKCELWGPGCGRWAGPDLRMVPWTPEGGVTILGVPINCPGSHAHAETYWGKVVGQLREAVQKSHGPGRPTGGTSLAPEMPLAPHHGHLCPAVPPGGM
jgi:hypothetical protein